MSASGGGALGSGHNLTVDREFRYIVQWFSEWSDFQRDDFVPVLASYLASSGGGSGCSATTTEATKPAYVNGIIGGMAGLGSPGQDKPMSLFQCRVKLFNEWSSKWPESQREKLLDRLAELDADFGRQVQRELSGESAIPEHHSTSTGNDSDPEEFGDPGMVPIEQQHHQQQQHAQPIVSPPTPEAQTSPTADTTATAAIALVIAEED